MLGGRLATPWLSQERVSQRRPTRPRVRAWDRGALAAIPDVGRRGARAHQRGGPVDDQLQQVGQAQLAGDLLGDRCDRFEAVGAVGSSAWACSRSAVRVARFRRRVARSWARSSISSPLRMSSSGRDVLATIDAPGGGPQRHDRGGQAAREDHPDHHGNQKRQQSRPAPARPAALPDGASAMFRGLSSWTNQPVPPRHRDLEHPGAGLSTTSRINELAGCCHSRHKVTSPSDRVRSRLAVRVHRHPALSIQQPDLVLLVALPAQKQRAQALQRECPGHHAQTAA